MAERKYFTIITDKGQIKIANAMVYGQKLNISTVVVGDGNGTYYVPTSDMTSIKNEVWRGTISKTEILQDAQKIIRITTVIPAEVSGFVVREIGLLDEDGELVAIGNVPDLPKVALQDGASTELKLVMRLAVKNTEVFSFTIDPHTVIMTKDMLDMHDIDENAHQELLDKKADKTTMTTELDKKVDKTAMATELEKKANTNHTHNYAGSSSAGGSATSAVKLQTARTIDGMNFNGSANITHFGVCSTAADVAAKTVALSGFVLTEGARVAVYFANANTAGSPTLNVNSTGAHYLAYRNGSYAVNGQWGNGDIVEFVYYSNHWIMLTANTRRLTTARTIRTNLGSTSSASFDGTASITPGVTGTLPIANGGTGATSASTALSKLGGFPNTGGRIEGTVVQGYYNVFASGRYAHGEGIETNANGDYSHAEGYRAATTTGSMYSHAEEVSSGTTGEGCHAEGFSTRATGDYSHSEGQYTTANGLASHAGGCGTIASANYQTTIGKYNKESTAETDEFIIGNGTGPSARSNCLRVTNANGVYSNSTYKSSGADYAELFQWLDDNSEKEDRVGLFVTLVGERIRIAKPTDKYILGIISGCPSVLGDVYDDQWKGMYEIDIYGRPILENVEVPAETIEIPDPENPEQTITKVIQEAHTEIRQKLNPNYDPTQEYIPRSERPEWDAVGMMGKLVVIDDGTCEVDGYCTVGEGGIATKAEQETKFYVMARVDKNHIRVMIW